MPTINLNDETRLKENISHANIPTPAKQDRLEVRLLTIYITLSFLNDLIGPITYVYNIAPSMLYRVASMASSDAIGVMFITSLALMIPHTVALILLPNSLYKRWPRKLATIAAVISCLTWIYLSALAQPIDMMGSPLSILYARQSLESLFLAFIFAVSLNHQQLRALHVRFYGR